jgi:hypothetical protein
MPTPDHTTRLDLRGTWSVRPDPVNSGYRDSWRLLDRLRDGARTIDLPAPVQRALGPDFRGIAWLGRDIDLPADWRTRDQGSGVARAAGAPRPAAPLEPQQQRFWLRIDAAATDCTVFINGTEIGRHVGDFLPFEFDATDAILAGDPRRANICLRIDQLHAPRPAPGTLTEHGHITKGFHDVLSMQHAGVWDGIELRRTGPAAIAPDGVVIDADPATGRVTASVRLQDAQHCVVRMRIREAISGREVATAAAPAARDAVETTLETLVPQPKPWSPRLPDLYEAIVDVLAAGPAHSSSDTPSDSAAVRFGFRTVSTGGPDNRRILLNGEPLLIRGILHWGHEPQHGSPAPTPEQTREEFKKLRELGFNCVCLCMLYPPRHYYDIADETGMLLWQEHPLWKCAMRPELNAEYMRVCEALFRRDASHPSIVIISAACEHEFIDPQLVDWWWATAGRYHPRILAQIQTGFMEWTSPDRTELYDDHTYDNTGKWPRYFEDLDDQIRSYDSEVASARARAAPYTTTSRAPSTPPPRLKPFVMGETVIANAWPDVPALLAERARLAGTPVCMPTPPPGAPAQPGGGTGESLIAAPGGGKLPVGVPWYETRGLDACAAFEKSLAARFGDAVVARFRVETNDFGLEHRRRQSEILREHAWVGGWVMNHIRDVPMCRCGFLDDLDRWRFAPEQTIAWLGETALLAKLPNEARAFVVPPDGREIAVRIGASNFGSSDLHGNVDLSTDPASAAAFAQPQAPLDAPRGEARWTSDLSVRLEAPGDQPLATNLRAEFHAPGGIAKNAWRVWRLPQPPATPPALAFFDALPFTEPERSLDFEEKGYSSGWALRAKRWSPILQHPRDLFPSARGWTPSSTDSPSVLVTHRLTHSVIDFALAGGRVLLLASKAAGALDAKTVMLWGQVPLILDHGPLAGIPTTMMLDLLHLDLTRRHQRAVPTQDMGIHAHVHPLLRLVYTHDSGVPKVFDTLFAATLGAGVLLVSSLDHTSDEAGRWLAARLVDWLASGARDVRTALDPSLLRNWIVAE